MSDIAGYVESLDAAIWPVRLAGGVADHWFSVDGEPRLPFRSKHVACVEVTVEHDGVRRRVQGELLEKLRAKFTKPASGGGPCIHSPAHQRAHSPVTSEGLQDEPRARRLTTDEPAMHAE